MDRLRAQHLFERSLANSATDEELAELATVEAEHPEWLIPDEPPVAPVLRKMETFTTAEMEEIAASQRTTVKGLKSRWIIQRGNSYYVLGAEGKYRPPIIKTELATSLPRDLCRVRCASAQARSEVPDGCIQWEKMQGEQSVRRTVDEFLFEYSTVARKTVASMALSHSFYDPETETFYEHVNPLRTNIVPKFNPFVDRWLDYLGGDDSEKLKDWMAVSPELGRPICALYFHAPKDAGKTMFATGMARCWSESSTELESARGDFNSAMADNPLIFADEELPKGMSSGFLRKFVGQSTHPFKRKGIPETKLLGCFRLVMAANNPDLLKFDEEDFSPDDIAAIASRLLYIKCHPDTAAYLESLGGREGTKDWVDGDVIAAHALWLRQTRVVKRGNRFLVTGKITDIHRRIATHGSVRGLVLEWICKSMFEKNRWKEKNLGIVFGNGKLYVNASYVKDKWKEVLGDDRVPSLKKIGQALKPLSTGEHRMQLGERRADFYDINPDHIYDNCRDLQIGTPEDYRRIINGTPFTSVPTNGQALKNGVHTVPVETIPDLPPDALPVRGLFALENE